MSLDSSLNSDFFDVVIDFLEKVLPQALFPPSFKTNIKYKRT